MEFLRRIADTLDIGLLRLAPDGAVEYCNQAGRDMLGLPPDGPCGRFGDLGELHPADFWRARLDRKEVMIERDGELRHLVASAYPDGDGVTMHLERETRPAEDEFRFFVMDNMSEGVLLIGQEGEVLYANNAAKSLLAIPWYEAAERKLEIEGLGEFLPKGFWRYPAYKREVLLRNPDQEVHFLASIYPKGDKTIVCFEEEKRENIRYLQRDNAVPLDLSLLAAIPDDVRREAMMLAASSLSFLVTGESGTGKEVMARAIHFSSHRAQAPFMVIDCTSLPESLVESELFGYEPGSFTGGRSDGRAGRFELADGGTVLLDEVADLPLGLQPKMLRFLNDGMLMRIGARKPKQVDVRVIACSNRDLKAEVENGRFRGDLYFRLKGAELCLPPLRSRRQYMPQLVEEFIKRYGHGRKASVEPQVMELFSEYQWPGNIRELEKAVQYMLAKATGPSLGLDLVPQDLVMQNPQAGGQTLDEYLALQERALITRVLKDNGGNAPRAARQLGISKQSIYLKIKRHHITHSSNRISIRYPKRMGHGNKARLEILSVNPLNVAPNEKIAVRLRVTNKGVNPWLDVAKNKRVLPGKYYVLIRWRMLDGNKLMDSEKYPNAMSFGSLDVRKEDRIPLKEKILPGENAMIEGRISAPKVPGSYYVEFSMTQIGVCSFLDGWLMNKAEHLKQCPHVIITIK